MTCAGRREGGRGFDVTTVRQNMTFIVLPYNSNVLTVGRRPKAMANTEQFKSNYIEDGATAYVIIANTYQYDFVKKHCFSPTKARQFAPQKKKKKCNNIPVLLSYNIPVLRIMNAGASRSTYVRKQARVRGATVHTQQHNVSGAAGTSFLTCSIYFLPLRYFASFSSP